MIAWAEEQERMGYLYPVDLNTVWKALGYHHKSSAIRFIKKNFEVDRDWTRFWVTKRGQRLSNHYFVSSGLLKILVGRKEPISRPLRTVLQC